MTRSFDTRQSTSEEQSYDSMRSGNNGGNSGLEGEEFFVLKKKDVVIYSEYLIGAYSSF